MPFGLALSTISGRYCASIVSICVDRQAEVAGKILNLGIAENGFQLIRGDGQVLAVAQP